MFGRKKREAALADEAASLDSAFKQLDLFSSKLDTLKQSYNRTARELAALVPITKPSPAASPTLPPLRPPAHAISEIKPSGRYSVSDASEDKPSAPLTVPRPTPRLAPEPPKPTRSGRYYLQLANARDPDELRRVREEVSKCGRVVDSGQGTASDPDAGWVEVAVRAEDTGSFIIKLSELEVKPRVEKVVEISPGEGRVQARQMDLFRKKQDSKTGI